MYLLSTSTGNQLVLVIVSSIGLHGFFYILTGFYISAFFFVLFAVPETKVQQD